MAFFFLNRDPARPGDRAVSALMVFLAAPLIAQILAIKAGPAQVRMPWMYAFPLAYGPLLLYYTGAVAGGRRGLTPADLLHLVPCMLAVLSGAPFLLMEGHFPAPSGPYPDPLIIAADGAVLASIAGYSAAVFIALRRLSRRIPEYYSRITARTTLHWLLWIAGTFAVSHLLVLTVLIAPGASSFFRGPHAAGFARAAGTTFFIYAFSFFSLNQPPLMESGEPFEEAGAAGEKEGPRYEKSGLKEEDALRYLSALEEHMAGEKPYLEGDLTIVDVSDALGIPKHYITQIINEKLNKNFYTYVNTYRVEEAVRRMTGSEYRDHTVLRIAYDSGFNSKSAFNTIFKKFTGFSPTEFRKRHAMESAG